MIEKGAMLTSGGTSRQDPEEDYDEGGDEEGYEGEGEGVEGEVERGREMDGISSSGSASGSGGTSRDWNKEDGSTAERVYQGLLPQHFNLPQKVI